ncbi:phospholipase D-like domain-containing protein [Deinococcus radiophilus]|uniref:phospholipase D-like domain-containing protein n=1 Tax=Deinococcus radiophilus TaxID=32062 RepID=UPI001E3D183F|nr:phospholipase D-like domain-containing protein [Deinococcus radiophilus]UFA51585.1 phospholipase D-like domain-containing protein [Deinococcus radiophilus]
MTHIILRHALPVCALLCWPAAQAAGSVQIGPLTVQAGSLPPPPLAELRGGAGADTCSRPAARLDAVLYDRLLGHGAELSCGNLFLDLLELPGDAERLRPWGGYEALAREIRGARHEVLLANMLWDGGPAWPGRPVTQAIAELRTDVLAHPERYPDGMTVRILLGHTVRPLDAPLDPRLSLDYLTQDLLAAGLPLTGEAEGGWRLEIADYTFAVPHSHSKFLVTDRERLLAGGFSVSSLHLPPTTPGGQGSHDLGLHVQGPVARQAVAAFEDLWSLSQARTCPAGLEAGPVPGAQQLRRLCQMAPNTPTPPLVWVGPPTPAGTAQVYPLYRRSGYEQADDALAALLGASTSSLDLMQAQVSGDPWCDLALGHTVTCQQRGPGLPVWQAIAGAVRERGVRVRLLLDQGQPMQTQGWALLRRLRDDLARTGHLDQLEVRWAPHRLHTKAILIDRQMTVVGSTNLHFSSFGPRGLTEYALATSDPAALAAVQANFDTEWAQGVTLPDPWWLSE